MRALILAAGYATRLYPLTKAYPKPLLKVGGRPIIDYIVRKLEPIEEVDEIIVVTNSKFFLKFNNWARQAACVKPISIVDDLTRSHSDRRGAIGDMHFVIRKKRLKDELLVIGGDNLFDSGLEPFFAFARQKGNSPCIGVYDLADKAKVRQYGVVKLNRRGRITDFQEKPAFPRSTIVAMCVYYFPADKLKLVGDYICGRHDRHDATGFYIDWLKERISVYGYVFGGRWYDIGHRDFYQEARAEFGAI
jgi:glucose-1-phosphate thymidylyltransferase